MQCRTRIFTSASSGMRICFGSRRAGPRGQADHYWFRAEAEVAGASSGDDAPPGTPGAGEHICPACQGTGRLGRKRCTTYGGTGRVIEGPEP